ncbi:hypothetical protein ACEPAF_749 [Sanghuangporus sanghuang]
MRNTRPARGDSFIVVTSEDAKVTNPNRLASSAHEALRRGKACLGCRRRKMKCDGLRPVCTQCSSRNRIDDCEYTDATSGPTRTQILEEQLARLQARVKELEKPGPSKAPVPTISISKPHTSGETSKAEPLDADVLNIPDAEAKPDVHGPSDTTVKDVATKQTVRHEPELSETPEESAWWELEDPPLHFVTMLVRLFLPNSRQLGFALNVTRFLEALSVDPSHPTYPHRGLMNAIFLWALSLSSEPTFRGRENVFLQRAINILQNVIGGELGSSGDAAFPTKVLHVMQAEVLIAQYFFTHGRILEGRYHANAAVSLAVSYGFHRISASSCTAPSQPVRSGVSSSLGLLTQTLPPVTTCVEFGERVNMFWAVYNVDRCWTVVGNPCIMSDDPAHGTQIDTPWPWDMHEYETADMNKEALSFSQCDRTIQRFLAGDHPPDGTNDQSYAALRVKASAIHGHVQKLISAWKATLPGSPTRQKVERDMRDFSGFVTDYISSLPEVEALEEFITSSDDRRTIYVIQALANTSMICLHEVWAEEGSREDSDICLHAAYEIARVPRAGIDQGLFDPVLGTTGMILASLFGRELIRAKRTAKTLEDIKRLERIEDGMEFLKQTAIIGAGSPVYGIQVPKILSIIEKVEKRK